MKLFISKDKPFLTENLLTLRGCLQVELSLRTAYQRSKKIVLPDTGPRKPQPLPGHEKPIEDILGFAYVPEDIITLRFVRNNVEQRYQELIESWRLLVLKNPHMYQPKLAAALHELGYLYHKIKLYEESERKYQESASIWNQLSQSQSGIYKHQASRVKYSLSILYANMKNLTKSEEVLLEILQTREQLSQDNSILYSPYVAQTVHSLAWVHFKRSNFKESLKKTERSIRLHKILWRKNPKLYGDSYAKSIGMKTLIERIKGLKNDEFCPRLEYIEELAQSISLKSRARRYKNRYCNKSRR